MDALHEMFCDPKSHQPNKLSVNPGDLLCAGSLCGFMRIWIIYVHDRLGGLLTLKQVMAKIEGAHQYLLTNAKPVPLDVVLLSGDVSDGDQKNCKPKACAAACCSTHEGGGL